MQLWKKMKKNRKGFTLVEIIVVLVILAILAAFTIPAMLGFVDDARGKARIAEAREIYVAYQSAATEVGAAKTTGESGVTVSCTASITDKTGVLTTTDTGDAKAVDDKAFAYLTTDLSGTSFTVTITSGKVDSVEYIANGYTVTLKAGGDVTVTK